MYMWVNYNIVTLVNYKFMLYLPRPDEQPATGGPIEPGDKEIRQEPYKLPG